MTLFWLIGAAAAAAVLAWVLRPLLSRRHVQAPSRAAANVAVYRDQLRELDADLAAEIGRASCRERVYACV